uniref:Glutaredoxin domain-containing protein n=1 Tax=Romanomermis culicivorax TaxID=13658 RepID=A0A915J723_ROMCU
DASIIERVEGADPAQFVRKVKYHNQNAGILPFSTNEASAPNTNEDLGAKLKRLINSAKCMVFMKGNPEQPRCGFSKQLMTILNEAGAQFETFDILLDDEVRQGLKTYSNWPTYPQVYVDGELVGGLDIIRASATMPILRLSIKEPMANAVEFLKTKQVSEILSENEKGNVTDYRMLCTVVRDCPKLPVMLF